MAQEVILTDRQLQILAELLLSIQAKAPKPPEFIDAAELAKRLGVSKSMIEKKVRNNEIPSMKVGRRRLFCFEDVKGALIKCGE